MSTPQFAHRLDQLQLPFGWVSVPLIVLGLMVLGDAVGLALGQNGITRSAAVLGRSG